MTDISWIGWLMYVELDQGNLYKGNYTSFRKSLKEWKDKRPVKLKAEPLRKELAWIRRG